MSDEMRDLYQEVILDHNKQPRNFHALPAPARQSLGHNPLCGDKLVLFVASDSDRINDIAFQGSGCAISTASASLMTEAVKGKSVAEAHKLFQNFHQLVTGHAHTADADLLDKLYVFSGVAEYPARVKCATLCWHTLESALSQADKVATTE